MRFARMFFVTIIWELVVRRGLRLPFMPDRPFSSLQCLLIPEPKVPNKHNESAAEKWRPPVEGGRPLLSRCT